MHLLPNHSLISGTLTYSLARYLYLFLHDREPRYHLTAPAIIVFHRQTSQSLVLVLADTAVRDRATPPYNTRRNPPLNATTWVNP